MFSWAAGKKTYLASAFLLAVLVLLVNYGKLTPELALDILVFAAPCFAATFRSAIETHHAQVLAVLEEIAQIGADVRLHRPDVLAVDAEALVKLAGPVLVPSPSPSPSPNTTAMPTQTTQSSGGGILSGGWPDKSSASTRGAD